MQQELTFITDLTDNFEGLADTLKVAEHYKVQLQAHSFNQLHNVRQYLSLLNGLCGNDHMFNVMLQFALLYGNHEVLHY